MPTLQLLLADAILVTHALIVFFNVASLPVIWVGYFRGWRFVRNFYFRVTHILLIGYVAAQAMLGKDCPLTIWEDELRVRAGTEANYAGSFVAHWIQRAMFYEADEKVFTVAYVTFFLFVLGTLFWISPNPPRWWRNSAP